MSPLPTDGTLRMLFVCFGNICRSPMAEGLARDLIERESPGARPVIEVSSAGVGALEGGPATPEAALAMLERGIDISGHRARRVSAGLLQDTDLVLAMEESQKSRIEAAVAAPPSYVLLRLSEAAGEALERPEGIGAVSGTAGRLAWLARSVERKDHAGAWRRSPFEYDVPDPIGLPLESYRAVAATLEGPIRDLIEVFLIRD